MSSQARWGPLLGTGLVSGLLLGCATASSVGPTGETLSFGCDDAVVIGTLKNGSYRHVDIPDDLLGHGWATGEVSVRMVMRGGDVSAAIPVEYFTHAMLREDREFMFVLHRRADRIYEIRNARLMESRPRLARSCDPAPFRRRIVL